jgi:DNA-binding CsgD family transcriptional regulator
VLAPLGHADVMELAAGELAGARPRPELERQLASAAGNPLFVTELLGSLSGGGLIELGDGVAEVTEPSPPASLRLTILRRVGALGDPRWRCCGPRLCWGLDIYERLDARRDTARTLAAMRSCGLRRGSRAAHRRALKGWDALTAMENDVMRLTVEGLTNRQIGERLFISRRTVQTHTRSPSSMSAPGSSWPRQRHDA